MLQIKRLLTVVFPLAGLAAGVYGQTAAQYLQAPRVGSRLRVEWQSKSKSLHWTIPGENPVEGKIGSDSLFLANQAVAITYPRLNPLRVQATASAKAVDDPSHNTIASLIKALLTVASTISPEIATDILRVIPAEGRTSLAVAPKAARPACTAPDYLESNECAIEGLRITLASAPTSGETVKAWVSTLDADLAQMHGHLAIQKSAKVIRGEANRVGQALKKADGFLKRIETCANATVETTEAWLCRVAQLSKPGIDLRMEQLSHSAETLTALAKTLEEGYTAASRWKGEDRSDFQINDPNEPLLPTAEKMQKVTVKIHKISLTVNERTSALTVEDEEAGSAEFVIRRYSWFLPEIGVGAVFSKMKAPKYGTATNDEGKTVVARVDDAKVSINPTIMVNFLLRTGAVHLAPMIQIGAMTSKETPALLLGGGVRLFSIGKGDVAIGAGVVAGWVRDLQTLKPGLSVVTGTKDIESDLGFGGGPRTRSYLTIQYKF